MRLTPTQRGLALAALVAVVWGLCFVIIKASAPGPVPLLHAGLRSLVGGSFLLGWIGVRAVATSRRAEPGQRLRLVGLRLPSMPTLLLLALANSTLAFGAMYLTAGRAEAAVASVLAGGQPLVLTAAGWLLFGERATARTSMGLVLGMTGIALIASTSSGSTRLDGVALSLVATISPALGTILMRRIEASVDLVATTGIQFLLGGIVLLVGSAFLEPWPSLPSTQGLLMDVAVQGVLGTGLGYAAWFWLLPRVALIRLATVLYLVPVTGVVVAILAGDRPGPSELAGAVIVLVGLGLSAASVDPLPPVARAVSRG